MIFWTRPRAIPKETLKLEREGFFLFCIWFRVFYSNCKKIFLKQEMNLGFILPGLTSSPGVPTCLNFPYLFIKIIVMQDKYFSEIKIVCWPLWLIAALKAKNFLTGSFCGPRKLSNGKPSRTGTPSLMYHGVTPAKSMGGKTNHFSKRHSMKKRTLRVRVTWSDRLQHTPDLMQTCSLFLAVINACGNRLVL